MLSALGWFVLNGLAKGDGKLVCSEPSCPSGKRLVRPPGQRWVVLGSRRDLVGGPRATPANHLCGASLGCENDYEPQGARRLGHEVATLAAVRPPPQPGGAAGCAASQHQPAPLSHSGREGRFL